MTLKALAAAGLAVIGLAGMVTTAAAYPAVAVGPAAVREGPGLRFDVEDRLRFGERVDVRRCVSAWCYVQKSGPDGWVASRFLERGGVIRPRPPSFPGFGGGANACFSGPNGFFCFGGNNFGGNNFGDFD